MPKGPRSVAPAADARSRLPTRRGVLEGLGASLATLSLPGRAAAAKADGLHARAKRRGLAFGCQVRESTLAKTPALREAILDEAGMIVPDVETKWRPTAPAAATSDYAAAERLADFAARNGLLMRGHTAVWHQNPPVWASDLLEEAGGIDLALSHARDIVGHFRGRIFEWDVVNEAIHLKDGLPGGLRNWGPYKFGGYDFIADCFRVAHEADPSAVLCYNDFGLEHDRSDQEGKRRAVLTLLEELKRREAPIHGLGIQSHLIGTLSFDPDIFRRFVGEVADLGLAIRLTELDVSEQHSQGDIAARDRFVADRVRSFLDAALDETAVTGVLTWGLSDFDNWLTDYAKRPDGLPQRSLPLDAQFRRKPMWQAMADCFDNAPAR